MDYVGIFYSNLVNFSTAIGYILQPLGILCMVIWYMFSRFGMLYQGKSGNPGMEPALNVF
jgi:purine-cytosine permease-like protein